MRRQVLCSLVGALLLAGCSAVPVRSPGSSQAELGRQIADAAVALQGRPYRYGGSGPEAFDCSGLVTFVHHRFGVETPRTTAAQFQAARPVERREIAAGDLLFFSIDSPTVSHVAIYAGNGQFVHAPQTGRPVEMRAIDDPYYRSRLLKIGRLH